MSENNGTEITKEYLHQRFSYCPIDIGRPLVYREYISAMAQRGDPAGSLNSSNYYGVGISRKYFLVHRLVWLYKHPGCYKYSEVPPIVDHINKNPQDNRYENLRPASGSLNNFNRKNRLNSQRSSCYRGVSWYSNCAQWRATFTKDKKTAFLGHFPATDKGEMEAALAYDRAAFKEWGQDAVSSLNFPENKANYMGLDEHEQLMFSFCNDSPAQQILDLGDVVLVR
jgi:hypothetical protein